MTINGRAVFAFKSDVEPTFMLLFRREELEVSSRKGHERPYAGYEDEDEFEIHEFVIPAAAMRDRLSVLGISRAVAASALREIASERLDMRREWIEDDRFEGLKSELSEEVSALEALGFDEWLEAVADGIRAGDDPWADRMDPGSLGWLLGLWDYVDPRLCLRALVEAVPQGTVTLDVTELVEGGWLQSDVDPQQEALDHFGWVLASGSPAIVLAEGRTDIEVLQAAQEVLRPHLRGFVRFADFEVKPEGGAAALVRTLRALAAAGIANTIIALFDNDTAAADAMRQFDRIPLPPNFRVVQYPDVAIARGYPTLGPTGSVSLDVNGLACGIEMYLGRDVLTQDDGTLTPVQWTGYVSAIGRYQGELLGKNQLLERFRRKQRAAVAGSPKAGQDWAPLGQVLDLNAEQIDQARSTSGQRT